MKQLTKKEMVEALVDECGYGMSVEDLIEHYEGYLYDKFSEMSLKELKVEYKRYVTDANDEG